MSSDVTNSSHNENAQQGIPLYPICHTIVIFHLKRKKKTKVKRW